MAKSDWGDDHLWHELRRRVAKIAKTELHVGIVGANADKFTADGKLTLAELGTIHEYGSPQNNIPERSFIRFTLNNKGAEILTHQMAGSKDLLEGKTSFDNAMKGLGEKVVQEIRNSITSRHIRQGLAPSTIARKGHSTALIDTGALLNAINYKIVKG